MGNSKIAFKSKQAKWFISYCYLKNARNLWAAEILKQYFKFSSRPYPFDIGNQDHFVKNVSVEIKRIICSTVMRGAALPQHENKKVK